MIHMLTVLGPAVRVQAAQAVAEQLEETAGLRPLDASQEVAAAPSPEVAAAKAAAETVSAEAAAAHNERVRDAAKQAAVKRQIERVAKAKQARGRS